MKKLISIISIGIAFIACNKSTNNNNTETQMPKPSTSGANILACKVDGKVHVYKGTPSIGNNHTGVWASYPYHYNQFGTNAVKIDATDPTGYNDGIYLHIMYDENTKYPELNKKYTLQNFYQPASSYIVGGGNEFHVDTATSFAIFTRADSLIVSGSFEFHGTRTDGTKVNLTEGIFDASNQ